MSKNVFRGSTWGVLSKDSSNVVELVRKAYLDITGESQKGLSFGKLNRYVFVR